MVRICNSEQSFVDRIDTQGRRTALTARKERLRLARGALENAASSSTSAPKVSGRSNFPSVAHLLRKYHSLLQHQQTVAEELAHTRRILIAEVMEALSVTTSQHQGSKNDIGFLPVLPLHQLQSRCSASRLWPE